MKRVLTILALLCAACGDQSATFSGTVTTGPQGPQGDPGTSVTMVQFCPGITHYPSEFNEIAFCINNNLYAVYSKNDGFLTYIPPGTYSSNAIDSSCNFTVLPGCVIQN